VSALNRTLRSRGHGTLISWKEFQDVCQGKLDVLVHFDNTSLNKTAKYNQATEAFFPCKDRRRNTYEDLNVARTIGMNVFAVDSVEKFENENINTLPCVGFDQWRGSNTKYSHRAQFNRGTQRMVSVNYLFGRPVIPSDFLERIVNSNFRDMRNLMSVVFES